MKMVVCIKQVPSTNEVRMDPVTHTIVRDGRQSITNPFDSHAIELAVQLKEQLGGEICAISMGIPATERLLRDAISRGADKGMLLSDRAFAGSDTLATAYTLSLGIHRLGEFDLVLCGKMAVDGDTAQIGPELAENLGIPHVTDVCGLVSANKKQLILKRNTDSGFQIVQLSLPALITVNSSINLPRMPSIAGVRSGMEGLVELLDSVTLKADPSRIGLTGSPTQVLRVFTPQRRLEAVPIYGNAAEQAAQLAKLIGEVL